MAGMQGKISEKTHRMQHSVENQSGELMPEGVDKEVECGRRKIFLEGLNDDFRNLREDSAAQEDEEKESTLWDNCSTSWKRNDQFLSARKRGGRRPIKDFAGFIRSFGVKSGGA